MRMDIRLAFGKSGLTFRVPDDLDVTVLEPQFVPGLENPEGPGSTARYSSAMPPTARRSTSW